MNIDFNRRRLSMLGAALLVVRGELNTLDAWIGQAHALEPGDESAVDIEDGELLRGFDEAVNIYVQARNAYAESEELDLQELSLSFEDETYQEISEARRQADAVEGCKR